MDTNPDAKYLILINERQRKIIVEAFVEYDPPASFADEADMLLGMFKGDGDLEADTDDRDVVNDFTA